MSPEELKLELDRSALDSGVGFDLQFAIRDSEFQMNPGSGICGQRLGTLDLRNISPGAFPDHVTIRSSFIAAMGQGTSDFGQAQLRNDSRSCHP